MRAHGTAIVLLAASLVAGCGRTQPALSPFPHGDAIQLLDGPVHLGDDRAGGQNFTAGAAVAARTCSLVSMPTAADVYIQVREVRQTETLSNMLTVNGRAFPLPVTLERDPRDQTANSMSASPVERVRLEQGPSEICLTAGHKANGDIDDFEVGGVTLYVEGIDSHDIGVRRGLTLGQPAPSAPPSVAWGQRQQWPGAGAVPAGWWWGGRR